MGWRLPQRGSWRLSFARIAQGREKCTQRSLELGPSLDVPSSLSLAAARRERGPERPPPPPFPQAWTRALGGRCHRGEEPLPPLLGSGGGGAYDRQTPWPSPRSLRPWQAQEKAQEKREEELACRERWLLEAVAPGVQGPLPFSHCPVESHMLSGYRVTIHRRKAQMHT